jgi:hypothetical protein
LIIGGGVKGLLGTGGGISGIGEGTLKSSTVKRGELGSGLSGAFGSLRYG